MSAFGSLDTGFPMFNDKMNTEQKLKAVEDYLVQMLEQLRYTLNNLGAENFNEQSMNDIAKVISKPIIAEINDPENGLAARIEANAEAITSETQRATTAEGNLSSRITQTANSITAQVQGGYADAWVTSHAYYTSDVVKVETTSGGTTSVRFYKCIANHTSSASTKPGSGSGWSSKWVEVTAPNVQSMISANLEGVSLSYDPNHSGVGTNEVYLTLNKDGVQMGGGKVKIEDLDAGTITTGTLDAGTITLDGSFTVKDGQDDCGGIGGYYKDNAHGVWIRSADSQSSVYVENEGAYISVRDVESGDHYNTISIDCDKSYGSASIAVSAYDYTTSKENSMEFTVENNDIEIRKVANNRTYTKNLWSVLENFEQRISALENA